MRRIRKSPVTTALFFSSLLFFAAASILLCLFALPSVAVAQDAASGGEVNRNVLAWAVSALGWGYSAIFLIISFILGALVVMNLLTAKGKCLSRFAGRRIRGAPE